MAGLFQFDGLQIIAVQPAFTVDYNYICRTLGFPDVNTALLRMDDPDELFPAA